MKIFFIRNVDAEDYLESFLIAAVFSILLIRFYLTLTGYPQLGGGGFHIAHMLWGGFLMFGSIVLFCTFLNKPVHRGAAILGGIGFGVFIDELGKLITRDNNYFFKPTVAFIYVIFILIFLVFRFIDKERRLNGREYLVNALEITKQLVLEPGRSEKEKVMRLLRRSVDPLAVELVRLVSKIDVLGTEKSGYFENLEDKVEDFYRKLVKNRLFIRLVIVFFVLFTLVNLWNVYWQVGLHFLVDGIDLSFVDLALSGSTLIGALLVMGGVIKIFESRPGGYHLFRMATLVSIFLTQFFAFYRDQLGAIFGFFVNVAVLVVLQYMTKHEPHED